MIYRQLKLFGMSVAVSADREGVNLTAGYNRDPLVSRRAPPQTPPPAAKTNGAAAPAAAADEPIVWYHSFNLPDGERIDGYFDHNPILEKYNLPESFAGKTVLDCATFDGFWAFEFERRGAEKVTALDLDRFSHCDWPPARRARSTEAELEEKLGRGFAYVKDKLGSNVERVICSLYDLSPERLGMFDVVHSGDVLLHLNSPVKALQNIASVTREYAIISDVVHPALDAQGGRNYMQYLGGHSDVTWWKFSPSALTQMVADAGFSNVEELARFKYGKLGGRQSLTHVVLKATK